MAEENIKQENKVEKIKLEEIKQVETPVEQKKPVQNSKNSEKLKIAKKTEAIVNGKDLSASPKHAIALCNFIKGKEIDKAILELEEVVRQKRAIPMRGEIPHRRGMMSGRYPTKAAGFFIKLLKSLKSNAMVNEMELEKYKIHAISNLAPRPFRRFGQGKFKRCHVTIKLIPITIKTKLKTPNKKENKK